VPILSDPSIGEAINVGCDEIDRLALALDLPEAACKVPAETQMCDDTISGHDHLFNFAAEVRDRKAHQPRGCQRSGKSLEAPSRQCIVDKIRRQRCACTPFGFMAFLGVASLIGVIVSHVIVLFDFIEEMHEKGEPLERALPDAGIERIRPVMITVGATILALFPLALEGGPLWKPLCYAQIGGLAVATFITLLLVPVFYSIFVLDLKWIKWETAENRRETIKTEPATT
jgi:hypothetical protein